MPMYIYTCLAHLLYRDNLFPASGFQSYQFRIIEYRIGFNEVSVHVYITYSYVCVHTILTW